MDINDFRGFVVDVQRSIIDQIEFQLQGRSFMASQMLRNSAQVVLSGARSGRIYRLPDRGGTWQASAPGEPPAVRLNALRPSWRPITYGGSAINHQSLTVKAGIETNVKYAKWLEDGTRGRRTRTKRSLSAVGTHGTTYKTLKSAGSNTRGQSRGGGGMAPRPYKQRIIDDAMPKIMKVMTAPFNIKKP